ncbi:hypothetical protein SAY87_000160 [Trapa incisa]|uniref:Uncharacterized protein n=1 Tax=Trapa incisa TaxID=236973 RepID=A0AAN7GI49_9MYRT|nr:hypothetical protein SAY87_000160 [Trapa incisa]
MTEEGNVKEASAGSRTETNRRRDCKKDCGSYRGRVEESLNNEEIKMEIKSRLEEGQRGILDEVATQLEKQKEAALLEA